MTEITVTGRVGTDPELRHTPRRAPRSCDSSSQKHTAAATPKHRSGRTQAPPGALSPSGSAAG